LADQRDEGVINGDRTGVSGSGPFSPTHSGEIVAPTEDEEEIKNPEPVGHSSLLNGEPATEFLPEEAPLAPLAKTGEEHSELHREAGALLPTLAEEVEGTKKTQPIEHSSLLSAETATESFPEEATLAPLPKDEEGHSEFYRDAGVLSPTSEQIAQRAYELYLARGSVHGHEREDWLEAEKQLRELPVRNPEV
jgi:Protein of unknown function (DUF2934)